jgi:hypothetical protein
MAQAIQSVTASTQALVKDQVDLAKVEMQAKASVFGRGAAVGAAAGAFVIGDNSPAVFNQWGGVVTVATTTESLNGNNPGGASTINFLGGAFSLADRRYRVGAPRARASARAVPAE